MALQALLRGHVLAGRARCMAIVCPQASPRRRPAAAATAAAHLEALAARRRLEVVHGAAEEDDGEDVVVLVLRQHLGRARDRRWQKV